MKKILFCITTLNGGGAEKTLCNITLAMPDDVHIDILVNCEEPDKDYDHRGNVIPITSVSNRKIRIPFPVKVFFGRYYKLFQLKKSGGYDACISFMDKSNIANILTGNKYCKVILSERTTLSKAVLGRHIKFLAKMLYKRADCIVTLSKGVEEDLNENFSVPRDRLITIYNGFDADRICKDASADADINFDKGCFYFINTGRLEEPKGQWHLIRAFADVACKHPECRLIICGKGPYMDMLKRMAKEYGIQKKIFFRGFVKNPYAISKRCDAFVFTSLYEGLSNAIIENMICGLPIITTDFRYGAREILAPDTNYKCQQKDGIEMAEYGIIVPVCSGEKKMNKEELENEERLLSEAMLRVVEDNDLRKYYSGQSLKRAQDFAMDNKVLQWIKLLD